MTALELFNSQNFTKRKGGLVLLLNTNHSCGILDTADKEYFSLIINAHHHSHMDTMFHKVRIQKNPTFDHNNFVCVFTKGGLKSESIVGIGSTLKATPNRDPLIIKRNKVLHFLRFSVGYDMSYKKIELLKTPTCKQCGCGVTHETSHIDHTGELEFRHIANNFIDDVGLQGFTLEEFPGNLDFVTNGNIVDAWKIHHEEVAELQLLCVKCNLTKTKGW